MPTSRYACTKGRSGSTSSMGHPPTVEPAPQWATKGQRRRQLHAVRVQHRWADQRVNADFHPGLLRHRHPSTTNTPTSVPPTNTRTAVPPTNTPTSVSTDTTVATNTPEASYRPRRQYSYPGAKSHSCSNPHRAVATATPGVPTATPTACTLTFTDVPVGSTFYPFIRCLACKGIINGYPDGTFKPGNDVTRGQLSKIVSNSAGFSDNQTTQMFQDVPVGSTFYQYIGRLASRGFINGYPCGAPPAGACVPPGNLPYFLPNANSTRGQISKIVSNAEASRDTKWAAVPGRSDRTVHSTHTSTGWYCTR